MTRRHDFSAWLNRFRRSVVLKASSPLTGLTDVSHTTENAALNEPGTWGGEHPTRTPDAVCPFPNTGPKPITRWRRPNPGSLNAALTERGGLTSQQGGTACLGSHAPLAPLRERVLGCAPSTNRRDAQARVARSVATMGAALMGAGLAMIVGGPVWQRALVIGAVLYAYLGGRLVS